MKSEIIYQNDAIDWLQERIDLNDEHSIELARRFPEVRSLSIEEQLKSALDWLLAPG